MCSENKPFCGEEEGVNRHSTQQNKNYSLIDPCNGFVRYCCDKCIFYKRISDPPAVHYICRFNASVDAYFGGHSMTWVSAIDYDRYPHIRTLHDAPCFAFVSFQDVISVVRGSILSDMQKAGD